MSTFAEANKLYGSGYAYDELQEETSDSRLTLQVPGPLRGSLKDGSPYVLLGSLAKVPRLSRGTVELQFVVADVLEALEPRFNRRGHTGSKNCSPKKGRGASRTSRPCCATSSTQMTNPC